MPGSVLSKKLAALWLALGAAIYCSPERLGFTSISLARQFDFSAEKAKFLSEQSSEFGIRGCEENLPRSVNRKTNRLAEERLALETRQQTPHYSLNQTAANPYGKLQLFAAAAV